MEPLYWIPHREMQQRRANDTYERARAQSIAHYYRYRIAQRTTEPLLLPPGPLRKPIPEPQWAVITPARRIVPYNDYGHSLWVKYGHWQQLTAGMRCETKIGGEVKTYVSVHSEYGCRWHPLAQIVEWQHEHAAIHAGKVAA